MRYLEKIKFLLFLILPVLAFGQIHFSLPDTLYPAVGEKITIPISVDEITASDEVKSFKIVIGYDSEKFSYEDNSKSGTLSSDMLVMDNDGTENQVTFTAAGSELLTGSGVLLNFDMTVIDNGINDITINEVDLSNSPATYTTSDAVVIVNTKPVFEESLPDTTINEGETLNFNYQGFDGDGDDLTYGLESSIDGMTLSETGALSWTPDYEQEGSYEVIVSISDAIVTVYDTATVTVENTNQKPVFESALPDTNIEENVAFSFLYNVTDADGDDISLSLLEAPEGAELSEAGELTWTPGIDASGDYLIVVSADDGFDTVNDSAMVTVLNTYHKPVFDIVLNDTTIDEGEALTFQYSAIDEDDDDLSFAKAAGPEGLEVSEDGILTWTPDFEQAGEVTVVVSVTDSYFTVNDSATITVNDVNQAPEFTAPLNDTTIAENETLIFQYGVVDIDDDSLVFTLESSIEGMTISEEGLLSWTPTFEQEGVYTVITSVTDSYFTVYDSAEIVVTEANRAPEFTHTLPDTTIDENQLLTYEYGAEDPDGDAVTFSLNSTIDGQSIDEAGNFTWTPTYEQAGVYQVYVEVTDGMATALDTVTITVNDVNRPPSAFSLTMPVNDSEILINSGNIEDSLRFEWEAAADPDGDAVFYTLVFYNETDTLIAETNLTQTYAEYPMASIYSLMETNEVEEISGTWNVIASDGVSAMPANSTFDLTLQKGEVGIDDDEKTITQYNLHQNYPNPFNPTTTISYSVPVKSNIRLSIYNMLGKEVESLVNGVKGEGFYSVNWNAVDMPSGIYMFTISATSVDNQKNFSNTKKMMLLK